MWPILLNVLACGCMHACYASSFKHYTCIAELLSLIPAIFLCTAWIPWNTSRAATYMHVGIFPFKTQHNNMYQLSTQLNMRSAIRTCVHVYASRPMPWFRRRDNCPYCTAPCIMFSHVSIFAYVTSISCSTYLRARVLHAHYGMNGTSRPAIVYFPLYNPMLQSTSFVIH